MAVKTLALAVLTAVWLFEMLKHLISFRSVRNPVPENVRDVYDPETYRKWREYHGEKNRLAMFSSAVSFLVSFLLMAFNVFAAFAGLFPDNPYTRLFAVMLLAALGDLAVLPFSYYDTMRIEEKYGFNRSSKKPSGRTRSRSSSSASA